MATHEPLDDIALSHGQAKWVLTHTLDLGGWSGSALDAYVKLLRRGGVPFDRDEIPGKPGTNVIYGYDHLMELALSLFLHRQGILRGDVVGLIASMRGELRPMFRFAWHNREKKLGSRVDIAFDGVQAFPGSGIWLDLGLHYSQGDVSHAGRLGTWGPKLLGPMEAGKQFYAINRQRYYRDPVKISEIAESIVQFAAVAPEVKRGRQ